MRMHLLALPLSPLDLDLRRWRLGSARLQF